MEYYRCSTFGVSLTKALNTMIEENTLSKSTAENILESFDCNISTLLEQVLSDLKEESKLKIQVVKSLAFSMLI